MPLINFVIGALGGILTYYFTKLFFDPIIRYKKVKEDIDTNLILFANALFNDDDLNDEHNKRVKLRTQEQRLLACRLRAAYNQLPVLYRIYLTKINESPIKASASMIGFSNETSPPTIQDRVVDREKIIRSALNIPEY